MNNCGECIFTTNYNSIHLSGHILYGRVEEWSSFRSVAVFSYKTKSICNSLFHFIVNITCYCVCYKVSLLNQAGLVYCGVIGGYNWSTTVIFNVNKITDDDLVSNSVQIV